MRPGDILFVRTRTVWGAIIRWLTRSPVNHVALAVDDEHILEVQPETGARIIKNPYREYILGYCPDLTDEQRQGIVAVARSIVGRRYDWSLIGAILFRLFGWRSCWFREHPYQYICTEAVDHAYLSVGIDLVERRKSDLTPDDLLHSPRLRFSYVYETRTPA